MQKNPLNVMEGTTIESVEMVLVGSLTASGCLLLSKGLSALENRYRGEAFYPLY